MTTFDWFLIGWWMVGLVITIGQTGKPRKPLEPLTVAIITVIQLALIAALLWSRGVL